MQSNFISTALLVAGLAATGTNALAANFHSDFESDKPLTIAVFGDWPYNQKLLDNAPLLISSVNADREVSQVIHVGDIHSGSMACTSAGILPPIATSNPGWNQSVFHPKGQLLGRGKHE